MQTTKKPADTRTPDSTKKFGPDSQKHNPNLPGNLLPEQHPQVNDHPCPLTSSANIRQRKRMRGKEDKREFTFLSNK